MSFQQFLLILKARWKTILAVFSGVVVLAVTLSLVLPKQYLATTTVLVDVKSSDPIYGAFMQSQMLPGYMATQVDVITSDRVAQKVVRMLGLDKDPIALEQWRTEAKGEGNPVSFFADALQKKLDVKPSKDSSVITINFTGLDPKFAATVANAFAKAYIETDLELKVDPAKEYASWFSARTQQLRNQLEVAQQKLSSFQREKGIVGNDDHLDVETARLTELSTQLAIAQAQRADSSSRQRQASGNMETSADVLANPVIQALRADVVHQEAKLKEMSGQLGVNHPQYLRTQGELEMLKSKLNSEMRQIASSVGSSSAASSQREAEIRAAVEAQKQRVLASKALHDQISVLQKDVENAQKAYDMVGQRLSQTRLESQTQQTNVSVLTAAEPPVRHASPKLLLNTVLAIFLGSLLGIATALVLELNNRRIRSAEDLSDVLGVPVLAVLTR